MRLRRTAVREVLFASVVVTFAGAALSVLAYLSAPLWTFLVVGNPSLASPDGGVTVLLDVNGEEIGRVATAVDFTTLQGEIPVNIERVVLGTEDRRFYEHNGVDVRGLTRAIVSNARGLPVQGGSTITQQLVRNETGVGTERTPSRKIREMLNAWRVEGMEDKRWILRRYLDTVWLGDGVRGVESAAFAWYRKTASELTLAESAMISATLPCPEACNPLSHPVRAEQRRQRVLTTLVRAGVITAAEADAARTPSVLFTAPERVTTGDRWVLDTVRRELTAAGATGFEDGRWPGGLTIRTTIDLRAQIAANTAVADVLGDPEKRDTDAEAAAVMIDPSTGGVRAVVGGRDFNLRQVNAAIGERGAGSGRQGGSTAKIFAVVAALEGGMSATTYLDAPAAIAVGDKPVMNYDGRAWGRISLSTATRYSVNTAFVNLTRIVTPARLSDVAERFGLRWPSEADERAVIGVHETDPMQMASVLATLANGGIRITPHIVDSVERDGRVVYTPVNRTTRVTTPQVAADALELLRGVVTNGTGGRAAVYVQDAQGRYTTVPIAGKTGTTNDHADAWFVGTAPGLSAAVWIGNPTGNTPLGDVAGYGAPSGGGVPAKIFSMMMSGALSGSDVGVFAAPSVKLPGTRPVAAATPATEDRITGEELPIDGTGASSPTPFPSPTPESTDAAAVDPEPTTGAPAPSPAPSQGAEG